MVYLAALEYIANGLYVVPIRPNGKLLPPKRDHINYGSGSIKRSVIDGWFHPIDGRFKGWNIGIACGRRNGGFAIDVDVREDANGFEGLAEIEEEYGPLECPVAKTPGGGKHYLYRWQEFGANSTDKIARGIDTRGGTATAHKGHIVVFPSEIDGKMYEWEEGGDLTPIPHHILAALGMPTNPALSPDFKPGDNRGNENVESSDVEDQLDVGQIETMLGFIDPDNLSYDQWLRVGQSIHSQYEGPEGFRMWDDWSKRGARYKENECLIRWHGFDSAGSVRIGTLFYFAKEGGWTPGEDDASSNPIQDAVEKINETHALVMVGGKIRIVREKETTDPMLGNYDLMHRDDFRTLHANEHYMATNARGNPCQIPISDIWLASEARRTYPNGMGMFPDGAPAGWYNTWQGWSYSPSDEGSCDLYLKHIRDIICSGNLDQYNWVLDWLADGIQDPTNPKGCALVLKGQEGTGKGTMADTYGRLFGGHYRHLIDDHHLVGNFNAHLQDALMVFADEIIWGGNKKSAGRLKGLVTEKYILLERKGVDAINMRNMIRLIIASNEEWVIPAGPQARRWFVVEVNPEKRQDTQYFGAIRKQMSEGGMNALMHFLLEREITNDLSKAPHTAALDEQKELHQLHLSPVQWWQEILNSRRIDLPDDAGDMNQDQEAWPKIVNKDALYMMYQEWCRSLQIKPEFKVTWERRLKKFGVSFKRMGDVNRVWVAELPSWGRCVSWFTRESGMIVEIGDDDERDNDC